MRIVFCENNERDLSMLESYVKEFFEGLEDYEAEYASYRSGDELLAREDFVDFAFLDVEMPGLNGIQVGNQLKERNSAIKIFIITAYSDYLDEAMKFQVFRFLSKPLDKDRLHRNLKDALRLYALSSNKVLINTKDGAYAIDSQDIICIESTGRRTLVSTCSETVDCIDGIEVWKARLLPVPCFYQSHRAFIINMRYIYKISSDTVTLKFAEKEISAYLAKRRYTDIREKFMLFLESTK